MHSVVILISCAALHVTCALPLTDDQTIFMPGDSPIVFDVSGGGNRVAYNSETSVNGGGRPRATVNEISNSSIPGQVDGVHCGLPYGSTIVNGTCQRFFTQAYCSEGEWFVKRNDSNAGECVPRPCPSGQLYYEGSCVSLTANNTSCGQGQMLYVELTGEVHCDCEPDYFYNPWQGKCFTQHDRGHCNFGKYLEVTQNGSVKCVKNPCEMEGFKLNPEDGKCYQKQYRGICKHPGVITYSQKMQVECIITGAHTIFDLPTIRACPPGSYRDFSRRCREEYRVPTETLFPASFGECKGRFVKDARGICRRTNRLFG